MVNFLINDYDVVWPIVWFESQNQNLKAVTFEVNNKNKVNRHVNASHKLLDSISIPIYKTKYNKTENTYELLKGIIDESYNFIKDSTEHKFNNSHEYIENNNRNLNTIDIDYLWISDNKIRGLEVSTFFVPMEDRKTAERLVQSFVDKRCKYNFKIKQFELLSKCNDIFKDSTINMVFLNNKKCTIEIVEGYNAIWFPLDNKQIERMRLGKLPNRMQFDTLEKFINIL